MAPVSNVFDVFDKIQSADISVHQQRCVTVRNKQATCRRCAQACTSGALSLQENEIVFTGDRCIGCGTCATVCPTCALEANRPNDAQLQNAAIASARANDGVAVFACHQVVEAAGAAVDGEKITGVECLGRVEESLVTALVVAGVSRVVLVKGPCSQCDHAVGLETAQKVCATCKELLTVWGSTVPVEISEKFPASTKALVDKGYDESRRNFFFRAKEDARLVTRISVEEALKDPNEPQEPPTRYMKVMDDGTLPHFVPDRRERLLDNLAALGEPEDKLIVTRLWGHVVIDPDVCNSCRMCAVFCPTAAISKFDDADGTIGINHYPGDCVLCRCCEDICPTKALKLYEEVFAGDILSGTVERNEMHPPKYELGNPHKTRNVFRDVLKCPDVYDR